MLFENRTRNQAGDGKEEGKDGLIGMEARKGARGEVPDPVICDAFSL